MQYNTIDNACLKECVMGTMIDYGKQHVTAADIRAVVKVLKSDYLTQGETIPAFEKGVANYCGVKYAVAFSSATAALHGACIAAGIQPTDEVVTTPMTFAASANCVLYCGGKPLFVDIRHDLPLIDPQKLITKLTTKTKAVIAVDYSGLPADYDRLRQFCREHKLTLIADAAHSLGAMYQRKKVGTLADMTVFSFHPVKIITTGEGGMVVTNNRTFWETLRLFRTHGITKDKTLLQYKSQVNPWYYEMKLLGFNYRLTDIQAALGISQMKRLTSHIKLRRQIAWHYQKSFQGLEGIGVIRVPDDRTSAWHIFPLLLQSPKLYRRKKQIYAAYLKAKINPQVHYLPVHLHPYYRKHLGYRPGDFPNAELFYEQELTLPLYPTLSISQVNYVINVTKKIIAANN